MKYFIHKNPAYYALCPLVLLITLMFCTSCSRETSGTDLVTITGVNAFITDEDIDAGMKKTLDWIQKNSN